MKLEGKKAVITGAGGGLGRAMALELAREGASVAVWDIHEDSARETALLIADQGRPSLALAVDVADETAVTAAVDRVVQAWGTIDILINNAGICQVKSIEEISAADWDRVLAINLKGTFLCSRAVMALMKRNGTGRIINLGSVAGKVGGIAVGAHYSASKAAVMCLTKSLARELAPHGVNVNAIAPGVIESEMTRSITGGDWRHYLATIPLGRIGRPEEVGRVAVFLAGPDSDYLTGVTIDVNGGQFMD